MKSNNEQNPSSNLAKKSIQTFIVRQIKHNK